MVGALGDDPLFSHTARCYFNSLLASKIAIGTLLLGISSEYVNNNRKESVASAPSVKEQLINAVAAANDPPPVDVTTAIAQPLEKAHARSMSLVHLSELANQKRISEPPSLPTVDGGDEMNETSFRDADDNYQCFINDQNCPPVSTFSKAATPGPTTVDSATGSSSATALTAIGNKDEGIVFTTQTSVTNKKTDLNDIERYKMCGNSIII